MKQGPVNYFIPNNSFLSPIHSLLTLLWKLSVGSNDNPLVDIFYYFTIFTKKRKNVLITPGSGIVNW